jgi:hypothetical protein
MGNKEGEIKRGKGKEGSLGENLTDSGQFAKLNLCFREGKVFLPSVFLSRERGVYA